MVTSLKCASCGAALDLVEGKQRLKCPYCNTWMRLAKSSADSSTARLTKDYQSQVVRAVVSLVVFLVVLTVAFRLLGPSDPEIRIYDVGAALVPDRLTGVSLNVWASVETLNDMPHVAPHVEVKADCGGQYSDEKLFFMALSGLDEGMTKEDRTTLFTIKTLGPDDVCELQVSASVNGSTAKYCLRSKVLSSGACKTTGP